MSFEEAWQQLRNLGDRYPGISTYVASSFVVMLLARISRRLRKGNGNFETLEATIIKENEVEKAVELGKEGKAEIKIMNGKLYLVGKYDGADMDAELMIGVEIDLLMDKLAAAIPGQVDDAIIGVMKAALKVI